MAAETRSAGRAPAAFLTPGPSSPSAQVNGGFPGDRPLPSEGAEEAPYGTTVVAATFPGGVVLAGDRPATTGSVLAQQNLENVFPADEHSGLGIPGATGPAAEVVRLFRSELEHSEKAEGSRLSLEGKANRLAALVRGHLAGAFHGLAVVPLFAGWDKERRKARLFTYDVTGGRSEARFAAVGPGAVHARGSLKKLHGEDLSEEQAATAAVQALRDAADGSDSSRRIPPVVAAITEDGYRGLEQSEVSRLVRRVHEDRLQLPDGPQAPISQAHFDRRTGRDG
ncbi:proteasome subunit beta [Streptomyces xiaopingdaonensis]|uniref:proteasome subunit beta n=1 Tax=Streptomyces xiaopingdaonensis TaxID=1565415 RepID=UPI00030AF3E8|nr:proteasome subunit beta [Streptomyces xiaopingdaonensis]